MNRIIAEGKGLDDPDLSKNLAEGKYISVLNAVWSERDRPRRLEWLRSKGDQHALLIYERAIAETAAILPASLKEYDSAQDSKIRDFLDREFKPLILLAGLRVRLDIACNTDETLGDVPTIAQMVYMQALDKLIGKKIGKSLKEILPPEETSDIVLHRLERLKEKAKVLNPETFASPKWVSYHGMSVFTKGRPAPILPREESLRTQRAYLEKTVLDVEKAIATL